MSAPEAQHRWRAHHEWTVSVRCLSCETYDKSVRSGKSEHLSLGFALVASAKKRTCIRAHRSPHAKTHVSLSSKHYGFRGYLCTAGPIDGHRAGRASHRSSIHKRGYGGVSAKQILSMPSVRALAAKCKARWWSEGNLSPRCVRLASHSGAPPDCYCERGLRAVPRSL